MSRMLTYIPKVDIYVASDKTIYYAIDENTVNYIIQVCPNSTYTVTMTEMSTRLRVAFTTTNPLTTTSNITGVTLILNDDNYSAGKSFTYKSTQYGYMVLYVSNSGEYPNISIETDGVGGDDIYNIYCNEVSSGTALTAPVYADAGDWVLATVTTRSDTAYPDDWELLHVSQITTESTQRMAFLCKRAEANGLLDISITQSNSGRMYINLISIRDIGGFRYIEGSENFYNSNDSGPSFSVQRPYNGHIIWGCSANLWSTASPYPPWICAEISHPVIGLPQTVQQRQANFIDDDAGDERTFITDGLTSAIIDCVEVLPTYARKYLVRSDEELYTIADDELVKLTEVILTADVFRNYGLELAPDFSVISELINPEILLWQDSNDDIPLITANVIATPHKQNILAEPFYIIDSTIKGIESVSCEYSGSPLISLSFDGGEFEYYDLVDGWINADEYGGMLPDILTGITTDIWAEKITDVGSIQIRITLDSVDDSLSSVIFNFIN